MGLIETIEKMHKPFRNDLVLCEDDLLWQSNKWSAILKETKNLHINVIDLENMYDKISRELLWEFMPKKYILRKYISC